MLIELDRTIAVYRLSQITANKTSYATLTATLECTMQPAGSNKSGMAGGSYGEMFVIYMDVDKNIRQDDKIKDRDGNWYKVVSGGIKNRNDGFIADYMEVLVQRIDVD